MTRDGFIFCLALAANFLAASYLSTFSELGFINTLDQRWVLIFTSLTFPILIFGIIADLLNKHLLRWVALFLAIVLLVVVPTITSMYLRNNSKSYLFVHDNPIQIEESIKMLLGGRNPYSETFSQTPLKNWQYGPPIFSFKPIRPPEYYFENPSIRHVVSLPFGFLSVTPVYLIWNSIFGFFDARIFYLSAYVLMLVLATSLIPKSSRFSFLALFALNPYFVISTLEGHNDVLTVVLILLSLILVSKNKILASAVPLGLAVATKPFAWIFLVVYSIFLYLKFKKSAPIVHLSKFYLVILSIAVVFVLPFLFWDAKAFLEDTIFYVSGGLSTSYPIAGSGFSAFLLATGFIKNSLSSYPAYIFEILFGIPTLILSFYLLRKNLSLKMLLLCFSLFFLVIIFFSRFFLASYFGVILQFLILGYFLEQKDG